MTMDGVNNVQSTKNGQPVQGAPVTTSTTKPKEATFNYAPTDEDKNKGVEVQSSNKNVKFPYSREDLTQAAVISKQLVNELAPCYGTSASGAFLGDLFGDDDGRFEDTMRLFKENTINHKNIVAVLQCTDLRVLERVINTLDTEDEVIVRSAIANCLMQRAETLLEAGFLPQMGYERLNNFVIAMIKGEDFMNNITRACDILADRGVR